MPHPYSGRTSGIHGWHSPLPCPHSGEAIQCGSSMFLSSDHLPCADRLLLQRIRKSQSGTTLYREASEDAGDVIGPGGSHHGSANMEPGTGPSEDQRLLVVANRLPVSAQKTKNGSWDLQVIFWGWRTPALQDFVVLWRLLYECFSHTFVCCCRLLMTKSSLLVLLGSWTSFNDLVHANFLCATSCCALTSDAIRQPGACHQCHASRLPKALQCARGCTEFCRHPADI